MEENKMTREDKLYSMTGRTLIMRADELGIKVACNKTRTALKEAKSAVIERILAVENAAEEEFTSEEAEEIEARVACGETIDGAMQTVIEDHETITEEPQTESEEVSEEPKEKHKARNKKPNLKLTELTYDGETKSIREWAKELEMPWPTLYDRVNRNGWTVEEAIEIPLGGRRKK
jgi:predicted RNase H-like nuclease (RuvC/YqgF family)